MGMLICIVIAFAVTLGGFAILRRQMAKTDLEETKEQSYEAHYAFIVDNPEDEYWQQVYEAAKEEGKKILGIWAYSDDRTNIVGVNTKTWTWDNITNFINSL